MDTHTRPETTCSGQDCPLACRWRGWTPAGPHDVAPGGTWGHRDVSGLWWCERYAADLRPRDADNGKDGGA